MPSLVPCPACEQHAKIHEARCPHCGAAMRDAGGKLRRTATAAVLGLAAAAGGCDALEPVDEYGPPPTADRPAKTAKSAASATASASASAAPEPVEEYGPAPTVKPSASAKE